MSINTSLDAFKSKWCESKEPLVGESRPFQIRNMSSENFRFHLEAVIQSCGV